MSEEVNKEQTKGAKQEKNTELTDEQLDAASGGTNQQEADNEQIEKKPHRHIESEEYQRIPWDWPDQGGGGITATDDWETPTSG